MLPGPTALSGLSCEGSVEQSLDSTVSLSSRAVREGRFGSFGGGNVATCCHTSWSASLLGSSAPLLWTLPLPNLKVKLCDGLLGQKCMFLFLLSKECSKYRHYEMKPRSLERPDHGGGVGGVPDACGWSFLGCFKGDGRK